MAATFRTSPMGFNKKDVIDYGDAIVLPGLIDVHNHGYFGGQCNYCSKEWLKEWTSIPYEWEVQDETNR